MDNPKSPDSLLPATQAAYIPQLNLKCLALIYCYECHCSLQFAQDFFFFAIIIDSLAEHKV